MCPSTQVAIYLVQPLLGILSVFVKNMGMQRELLSCCNMTKTIGSSVLTLKWCASFLVSNVGTQSIPAFSVCGIAELERSIDLRRIGLQDLILNLQIPTLYMSHVVDRKKIIFPPLHIKLGLMKQFVKALHEVPVN